MWVDLSGKKPSLVKITIDWIKSCFDNSGGKCVICGNYTKHEVYNERSELYEFSCGPGEGLGCFKVWTHRNNSLRRELDDRDFYSDYNSYIRSYEWAIKATEAKELANWKCTKCRTKGNKRTLDAHHKHYKTLYHERPNDIEVLCRSCHSRRHGK